MEVFVYDVIFEDDFGPFKKGQYYRCMLLNERLGSLEECDSPDGSRIGVQIRFVAVE